MTEGYPGGFPFLFYCNLPGKNYRRGQTNPGTPQVYTLRDLMMGVIQLSPSSFTTVLISLIFVDDTSNTSTNIYLVSIGRQAPLINGLYLDGHVHWIVRDEDCPEKICAFNFDNETFKLFPSPPFDAAKEHSINLRSMGVLNGCLSQCDSTYNDVTIWVMNEYGIKNSWYKMANVRQYMCPKLLMFQPINLLHGLKDGGVLMVHYQEKLYAYYPGTNAIEDIRMFNGHFTGVTYRPSFVKLRDFEFVCLKFKDPDRCLPCNVLPK
nr:F-box associated domain, type 1 [Tanacetum cinerariifolium]